MKISGERHLALHGTANLPSSAILLCVAELSTVSEVTELDRPAGLRERKNRRTRLAIVRAAAELTIERGYAAATIARIAERADVSPRTVSGWFPTKDDIFFENADDHIVRATNSLRTGTGDVVDRIEAWLEAEAGRTPRDPDIARLRRQAIDHDGDLRARDRQHLEQIHTEVARAVARDTGRGEHDVGPQLLAGAVMSFLQGLIALDGAQDEVIEAQLATGYSVLRAALAALQRAS